jgi:biopolymer transport protein TolQ
MESFLSLGAVAASPFYAFSHCDTVGKIIVVALFVVSIYGWTIMIDKFIYLSKMIKQSKVFKEIFKDAKYPLLIYQEGKKEQSVLGDIYRKAAVELIDFYRIDENRANQYGSKAFPSQKLTFGQLETIRTILDQTVSDKILELEDKMGFLTTAISIGPLMGLFGTVWGIMMAFVSMALGGKADIPTMAPGVSSALLTTVLGLSVAIPSLIGYNFLSSYIKQLIARMDNFSEEFMAKLKLEHSDY